MTVTHVSDIALGLLLLRGITIFFTVKVIIKQVKAFKLHADVGVARFRKTMLALSLVFLLGNFVPIAMDSYYVFLERVFDTEEGLVILYTISNAVMSLAAAILLWTIYRLASKDIDE